MRSDLSGILLVDKPSGVTSHDVVDFIRRTFGIKKVGHCGTLDPLATGLLGMLIGKSTKLASSFTQDTKRYQCVMALGVTTDSQDSTGKVLKEKTVDSITEESVRDAINSFKGESMQMPPMVSAKHHKGV